MTLYEVVLTLRRLADAIENDRDLVRIPHAASSEGYLSAPDAAKYVGYDNVEALRKARERGLVVPVGRRGGKGPYMFRREDLDAFVRGEVKPPKSDPPPRRRRGRRSRAAATTAEREAEMKAIMAHIKTIRIPGEG